MAGDHHHTISNCKRYRNAKNRVVEDLAATDSVVEEAGRSRQRTYHLAGSGLTKMLSPKLEDPKNIRLKANPKQTLQLLLTSASWR